jgi:hypothetical protein
VREHQRGDHITTRTRLTTAAAIVVVVVVSLWMLLPVDRPPVPAYQLAPTSPQPEPTAAQAEASKPGASVPSTTPPNAERIAELHPIARRAIDLNEDPIDCPEDMQRAPSWKDRAREIAARENRSLSATDALHLGESADAARHDVTKSVGIEDAGGATPCVTVGRWDGFSGMNVGFMIDLKAKHVRAGVESWGDAFPQPPPAWNDIEGSVELSSWEWTPSELRLGIELGPDKRPIVLSYDLSGRRGRLSCRAQGKVVLAR